MDSMRSLNTSLPSSNPSRAVPPEQLLEAFKSAALSVTNLYKTAVTDRSSNRQSGYQDALDDLLTFMDKENLGVQDGEGWRIRQWATERFERPAVGQHNVESDDERIEVEKRPRSSSPALERKLSQDSNTQAQSRSISPMRTESAPPQTNAPPEPEVLDRPPIFRFTAAQAGPTDDSHMHVPDASTSHLEQSSEMQSEASGASPIRVGVVNRGLRTPHRNPNSRQHARASNRDFTFTSGAKRKFTFPDFFDISNLGNNGRDNGGGGGGGKRGRFV